MDSPNVSAGEQDFVICSENPQWQDLKVSHVVLRDIFPNTGEFNLTCPRTKILDILSACGAVQIVIKCNTLDPTRDEVVHIGINEQILTKVDFLKAKLQTDNLQYDDSELHGNDIRKWVDEEDQFVFSTHDCNGYMWAMRNMQYPCEDSSKIKQLVFRAKCVAANEESVDTMMDDDANPFQILTLQKPSGAHLFVQIWVIEYEKSQNSENINLANCVLFDKDDTDGLVPFDSNIIDTNFGTEVRRVLQFYCKRRNGPKAEAKRKRQSL